jgi:hypothetical protein
VIKISERYWITGVQLGMLKEKTVDEKVKDKMTDEIIDKQFIGNYYTEEEKKQFEEKMKGIDSK